MRAPTPTSVMRHGMHVRRPRPLRPGAAVLLLAAAVSLGAQATSPAEPGPAPTAPPPTRVMGKPTNLSQQVPVGLDVSIPTSGNAGDVPGNEWVFAPVPGYNPVLGATLLVGAAKIYRPKDASATAPAWMTGGGAFVAENKSWAVGVGHKMNLQDDRWRLSGGVVYADINYRFYGIGNDAGDQDRYVPIRQQAPAFTAKFTGRVASSSWYLGFKLMAADSTIRLNLNDLPSGVEPPPGLTIPDDAFKPFLASVTPVVEYDSRDDDFYPRHGVLFSASMAVFSDKYGSDFNFKVYEFAYNQYFQLSERGVLAVRGYTRVANGDVPFFALSSLGQGADLRGYTAGRYRDEALFSTQAEYRYELSKRWTLVAFAGVGGVGPSLSEIPQMLPAGGGGVRFSLGKENKLNLRLDVAWGKNDHAIYLSVGEAF